MDGTKNYATQASDEPDSSVLEHQDSCAQLRVWYGGCTVGFPIENPCYGCHHTVGDNSVIKVRSS